MFEPIFHLLFIFFLFFSIGNIFFYFWKLIANLLKKVNFYPNISRNLFSIIFLELISISVYYKWVSFSIFVSGDNHWLSSESLSYFRLPTAWNALISTGEPNWYLWNSYSASIFGLLGSLGFDSNIVLNILVLWFIVFVAPLISYLFIKKFTKKPLTAFLFSLPVLFNSYLLTNILAGHLLLSIAFYISLIALYFYISFVESNLLKSNFLIFAAIFSWVVGFIDFRIFYLLMICFPIYQILYFVFNKISIPIARFLIRNSTFYILIILLNINWLLPTIFNTDSNAILSRPIFAKGLLTLFNSWTGTYYYWNLFGETIWGVQISFQYIYLILPLLAMITLYYAKTNSKLLILSFFFLIGSFFGKQNTAPLARIYETFFIYIPGFSAFRDATKFFQITWWSLPLFLAIGFESISKKFVKLFIALGIILITSLNIFSLTTHQAKLLTPTSLPDYYPELMSLRDGNFKRTLWVPRSERFIFASSDNPRASLVEMNSVIWKPAFNHESGTTSAMLKNENLEKILAMSSISNIFVPNQIQTYDREIDDDAFYYEDYRPEIIDILDRKEWLIKNKLDEKDGSLYTTSFYRPHLYLTNKLETFKNMRSLTAIKVDTKYINSSTYLVYLKNISDTVYLTFTDSYSNQWILDSEIKSSLDLIFLKNERSNFVTKYRNQVGGNVFEINKDNVQKIAKEITNNEDGSINATLTLYYEPQKKLIIGNIITITTLLAIVTFIIINRTKNEP